jgi:hypothetical protein
MKKTLLLLAIVLVLVPICAFAIDGQVLINQSTVMAAGGFPYKITQTGSYKLSGNLVAPASVSGIFITADDVTLDLNGFTIKGGGGVISFHSGVDSPNSNNTTVKNGSVTGFSGNGITLNTGSVVDVHADGNGNAGIFLQGGVITRCTANFNPNAGFSVSRVTLSDSTASQNDVGISATQSTLIQNVVTGNTTLGIVDVLGHVFVLFGSNVIVGNGTDVSGGTSQHNNVCTSGPC